MSAGVLALIVGAVVPRPVLAEDCNGRGTVTFDVQPRSTAVNQESRFSSTFTWDDGTPDVCFGTILKFRFVDNFQSRDFTVRERKFTTDGPSKRVNFNENFITTPGEHKFRLKIILDTADRQITESAPIQVTAVGAGAAPPQPEGPPQAGPVALEVRIGELTSAANIAEYIAAVFKYALSIGGVLATVMVVYGGVKWLVAAGDATKIGEAKSVITNAVIGLVLLLGSYVILFTINPEIVRLRALKIPSIQQAQLQAGAAYCPAGQLGCSCSGDDPEAAGACDQGLTCVQTRYVFATDEDEVLKKIAIGAGVGIVGGAFIAGPEGAVIEGTIGVLIAGVGAAGETLYQCTDGRAGSPCDEDGDCQRGMRCQDYYHVCFKTPAELGSICNQNSDCKGGADCEAAEGEPVLVRLTEGAPSFCRGEGGKGKICRADADCVQTLVCKKPLNPAAFGRCSVPSTLVGVEEGTYCILTQDGSISPPACGSFRVSDEEAWGCYFCPSGGARLWTHLTEVSDPNHRYVGQCKKHNVRETRCHVD